MSWLKSIFRGRRREALAAEAAGEWRRAAALWAEAGQSTRAADALAHLAEQSGSLEQRLAAWHDALRWLPESERERRDALERRMAEAVLEEASARGAQGREERRRLAEAAERLERLGAHTAAADAFAMLGRREDQARCLEAAGEVERLEALLEEGAREGSEQARLRALLTDYEAQLACGARVEARQALREAAALAPGDRSVGERLRRLEGRIPGRDQASLSIDGRRIGIVGRWPAVLGRSDADIVVRGASVSRRHAEITLTQDGVSVRDLESRNGTLVGGFPIRGAFAVVGAIELGLGEDVTLRVEPRGTTAVVEVQSGLDRGAWAIIGEGPLRVDGLAASLSFVDGWATLEPDEGFAAELEGQRSTLPVQLLHGDKWRIAGVVVEVLP